MKIVATIEARMTSTRLPGKPLLLAEGISMLEHLVRRLKTCISLDQIILATTTNQADDILVQHAETLDIKIFRGSEEDVLQRVLDAAIFYEADVIVEITGDCPVIDPQLIEQAISIYKNNDVDYVSNGNIRSYPDGMDVQIFRTDVLSKSASMTQDPLDREHVTLHIRNNLELFSRINIISPPELYWPDLGLTLDEKDDYELLKKIISYFETVNPIFSCHEVINYLKENKYLLSINSSVSRKGDT
jgi:spore coat polysaccharide biosynthesis protein SpsF